MEDLIRKGESATLEFKSSLMTPTRTIPEVDEIKQRLSEITDPTRKKEQLEQIKIIEYKIMAPEGQLQAQPKTTTINFKQI